VTNDESVFGRSRYLQDQAMNTEQFLAAFDNIHDTQALAQNVRHQAERPAPCRNFTLHVSPSYAVALARNVPIDTSDDGSVSIPIKRAFC
jgi:hypothetical protein